MFYVSKEIIEILFLLNWWMANEAGSMDNYQPFFITFADNLFCYCPLYHLMSIFGLSRHQFSWFPSLKAECFDHAHCQ